MNGWTNYETWNLALWLQNDPTLYELAQEYAGGAMSAGAPVEWEQFLKFAGITRGTKTPDGVSFRSHEADREELRSLLYDIGVES
jgi:hypothetical protein